VAAGQGLCPSALDLLGRALNGDVSPLLTAEDVEEIIVLAAPART
jgi:hypothetical protein